MAIKRSFILSSGLGVSADNIFVVNNTNSVSSTTGSIVSTGGVGIGQSVSISGRLQLFNSSNYTAFVSSASGNTVYTLPANSPATGSSVLQSTSAGVMSWVPMTATGGGGTGSGTVSNGNQYEVAFYASTGTTLSGNSCFTYNSASNNTLTLGGMTLVGSATQAIQITSVGNAQHILTTWSTLNSGLALDATNASLRIVGDTNAGTTLVDLGIYDNSGFPTGNWNSKYLFPKSSSAIFVNGLSINDTSNSTTKTSGALTVSGGAGIGLSISIGGRLQIFNGANYTAFVSSASGNTVYTLPSNSPAIGTSVLQSDSTGIMSWVPMVASASGTTSQSIAINPSGSANVFHPIIFTPSSNSSGSAVSTDSQFTFNALSDVLYVPGIAVTASTVSTSTSTGSFIVTGGVGIGGSLYVASATAISGISINNGIITGSLSGTATTSRNLVVSAIGTTTTDHFLLLSPTNTGSGVAVSSGTGLTFTPSNANLRIGGLGISSGTFSSNSTTLNLFNLTSTTITGFQAGTAISLGASTGTLTVNNATLRVNQSTASTNTTSGSIVAIGGVGIGGNLNVGGTATSVSGVSISSSVINLGTWSASAITSFYGGTGIQTYATGDLLVGTGATLTKQSIGTNNQVLIADLTQPTDLRWGLVANESILNPFIGIGGTTVGFGATINLVAGAGISFLYSGNNITVYNRSGVLITSTYPLSPLQGDLFWHDEEGVLKVYYDDNFGAGQWVDANQRWGQGQYVTFPSLGSGSLYEVAYYSGAGHTVTGAYNFTNNTSTAQVAITYTTNSTSTSTGAFVVNGGVGVGGTINARTVVSNSGFVENVYSGGTAGTGSTIYPNWSQGSVQTYTLAGNCWLGLPTNMPSGASLTLIISQNATGGWAMTSDSNIKYAGGNKTVSTGASVIDVINMFYTGSTYLAALTTGYS